MKQLIFPIIEHITINCFSLYKKNSNIEIDLKKNVFCLAGANGLGKSTFITIINYALTGIVRNPTTNFAAFNSIPNFYSKSKSFSSGYFSGRVEFKEKDLAEVTLDFKIDNNKYRITRGFFEQDELREFKKWTDGKEVQINNLSPSHLNDEYKGHLTKDAKLSEFDQFVFLQTYLLTFDETHQLLFWDQNLMERVLYLFFGVDPSKARQADLLRKDYSRYDSNVRNLQYQMTRARNELKILLSAVDDNEVANEANEKLINQYKNWVDDIDEMYQRSKNINLKIKDIDLIISDLSLRGSSLRSEYEVLFSQSTENKVDIEKDPRVIKGLQDLEMKIIAEINYDDEVIDLIDLIKERKASTTINSDELFDKLQSVDQSLMKLSQEVKDNQRQKDKLISEDALLTSEINKLSLKISEIEEENKDILNRKFRNDKNESLQSTIRGYEEQIARFSNQKDENYEKRNRVKKDLDVLESELNKGYIEAESKFLPLFNDYAQSFLGLDVHVGLLVSSRGVNLSLHIGDSIRREAFQLSESQRYFIDIALRMALIDLNAQSATLLVDTPEGSLDIAYESRAGRMLAEFSRKDFKLVMTANINTSQLLYELASICKKDKMTLERMTNWTTLSNVQQEESAKIEDAFDSIERILLN